jgi:hypothetical protein
MWIATPNVYCWCGVAWVAKIFEDRPKDALALMVLARITHKMEVHPWHPSLVIRLQPAVFAVKFPCG